MAEDQESRSETHQLRHHHHHHHHLGDHFTGNAQRPSSTESLLVDASDLSKPPSPVQTVYSLASVGLRNLFDRAATPVDVHLPEIQATATATSAADRGSEISFTVSNAEAVEAASLEPTPPALGRFQAAAIIATVAGMTSLNSFNNGLMMVALPTISADLAIPVSLQLWPSSVYSLTIGCTLLLFGAIADAVGNRPVFLFGSALFTVATLACSLSTTTAQLIAFKAIQGLGMAHCMPTFFGFISASFPPGKHRNLAIAALDGGGVVGFAMGLFLGGVLMEFTGWRSALYVCAAINVLLLVLAWFSLPRSESKGGNVVRQLSRGLDWVGLAIATSCLAMVSYVLTELSYSTSTIAEPQNATLLAVSLAHVPCLVLWIRFQERRGKPAIFPSSVWKKAEFTSACVAVFFSWATANSFAYLCSLYFQNIQGLSPIDTAVRFLPDVISGIITNSFVGFLVARVPASILALFSSLVSATAPVLFAIQDPSWSFWAASFPSLFLQVVAIDLLFSVTSLIITSAFPPEGQALAGGVFNVVAQLGSFAGLAATTLITTAVSASDPYGDPTATLLKGYRAAFWSCFAATIVVCGIGFFGLRNAGKVGLKRD
ncbi:hypothetical protein HK405_007381 [Cladochytrium tenue]|nr:hypothetical protein HK405_007381 [Cladochytrium tenue]